MKNINNIYAPSAVGKRREKKGEKSRKLFIDVAITWK